MYLIENKKQNTKRTNKPEEMAVILSFLLERNMQAQSYVQKALEKTCDLSLSLL